MPSDKECRREKPASDTQHVNGDQKPGRPVEIGGRDRGLEPTRYGDWEKDGRCIDF